MPVFRRCANVPSRSSTYAMPPLMPAAKLRPDSAEHDHAPAGHVLAAMIADTFDNARAPLLRTAKRSPATPRRYASPLVAP